ncbi:hypothetical protein [Burkholderia sp. Ac-20365]|uniref:hypothetical protein n=1 Tax=Burkholderia sp. Ac-20365 TaxID=2703897 RepID=UPI00197BAC23|nr:hypothetical protein [Burkholderia sp. Ac-20365]MBN3760869.1 hypothetical protein [Burkholderia sp. Ac-20365]
MKTKEMASIVRIAIGSLACAVVCSACTTAAPTPVASRSTIVVVQPKGEQGDFILCQDGRVLVFPVSHPKTCS